MVKPKKRSSEKSSNLLAALQFTKLVTKDEGAPYDTHVRLLNHTAIASNGILSCGIKIEEDLNCAPDNYLIAQALSKCGDSFSITHLSNERLSIKGSKFKAIVPCIDLTLLNPAAPDPPIAVLSDPFRNALTAVAPLTSEGSQTVVGASILMAGASLIATDRHVVIEYWHGTDLPTGIALPKAFAVALSKVLKPLARFGFSNSSVTVYFDDDSWLKSQIYCEPWPDVKSILDRKCNPWPVPNDFWKAFDAVELFSESGDIYFGTSVIRSHNSEAIGASHECFGIPEGPIVSIRQLQLIRPYVKQIDFQAPGVYNSSTMIMFYGENIRGAIAGKSK